MNAPMQLTEAEVASRDLTIQLASNLWKRLDIEASDPGALIDTLIGTLIRPDADGNLAPPAQIQAYLMVAAAHKLNPWLKEIHAFVDRGAIVPVVGIDGWVNIVNNRPEYDGCEFDYAQVDGEPAVTCIIYRKDRTRPIRATEFMKECKGGTTAWQKTPRRMLRHRAFMQCARLAFGIGGIRAPDEVDGYREPGSATQVDPLTGDETPLMPATRRAPPPPPAAPESHIVDVDAKRVPTPPPAQAPSPAAAANSDSDLPWQDDPAPAPAPSTRAPAPQPATTGGTVRPATDGEKANLSNKARAAGLDLGTVVNDHGFSLSTLTNVQFDTLKAWFLAR